VTDAATPFCFSGCTELLESLGPRANDERELADLVARVPAESIAHHTYGSLLRRRVFAASYGHDFATWTLSQARDRILGERLAVVDPFDFADPDALREKLVSTMADHLAHFPAAAGSGGGEPFHFMRSHVVVVPTGREARTLGEFRAALAEVDASVLYYHLVLAHRRLRGAGGDFGEWLREVLGRADVADQIARIDLYLSSLERVRARALTILDAALEATGASPAARSGETR
jgi:hypothetical protein